MTSPSANQRSRGTIKGGPRTTEQVKTSTNENIYADMATSMGSGFTIVTGGAVRTETLVQQCAEEWGMTVKLCLPPHHHSVCEKHPAISSKSLQLVQPMVARASRRLDRHPSKNPFVRDLLARNWFIVERAKAIFAYANFEDGSLTTVDGGTGMTVQMCVDHNRDFPDAWKELFVFDDVRGGTSWNGKIRSIQSWTTSSLQMPWVH